VNLQDLPPQPGEDRWHFVEDLQAPMWTRHAWDAPYPGPRHADLSAGARLEARFPDPAGRLETAYEDLACFLAAGEVPSFKHAADREDPGARAGTYAIETALAPDLDNEAYRVEVGPARCRILAADVEGIRRGIYTLEDRMLSGRGPFMPLGVIERRPLIRRRISRCFFGPIKRPPKMRDELMDDIDYYPAQYLNRLAHDGVNGLWLSVEFRDLCSTAYTPDAGQHAKRRLDKLRRTVASCLRYGIRTYVFCIEPRAWDAHSPVVARYPELGGSTLPSGGHCFCPSSDTARQYLYESVHSIFRAVPELGGLINITHGERPTTCLSVVSAFGEGIIDCPRCADKAPWEILHASLSAMERGMHDAAPRAELISWLYMPYSTGALRDDLVDWVYEIPAHTPERVILQFNFESGVRRTVFGKELVGGDYWLSTPGPSARFERVAEGAREGETSVSAKIQTACSHELATVPYLPVPSLLYRKFAAMRRLGVSHVMLCWYFGNYPGLMSKAAGELSFEPFPQDEDAFLHNLASIYWGKENVPTVVGAWKWFSQGYENYPLTNLFQYYGPMHDGPVWPLLLRPEDAPLSPTWLLGSAPGGPPWPPSGDRIGECFMEALTLDEMVELARRMSAAWDRGLDILQRLAPRVADEPERLLDIGVAEALAIQFRSGYNILRFYRLREEMFRAEGTRRLVMLDTLSDIIREELDLDERILTLCERDSRLGFHSEAEGYKYFPEKIHWRMRQLRQVLEKDVPELGQLIRDGEPLFPGFTGKEPTGAVAHCVRGDAAIWSSTELDLPPHLRWQACSHGLSESRVMWTSTFDGDALYVVVSEATAASGEESASPVSSVLVKIEPRRLWPCKHFIFSPGAAMRAEIPDKVTLQSVEGRVFVEPQAWRAVACIPLERIGLSVKRLHPVRLNVQVEQRGAGMVAWRPSNPAARRLFLGTDNPADLGWLLFDEPES
jgi:hypothetical protein